MRPLLRQWRHYPDSGFRHRHNESKGRAPAPTSGRRRWDTDILSPSISLPGIGRSDVIRRALVANHQQTEYYIDYFVFSRGLYLKKIPPLVIGRVFWDNWLIWRATAVGVPTWTLLPLF